MSIEIKKCAVLGAGVMGAQIAGHIANAGIPSLLLMLIMILLKKVLKG
jgi:3-hydroxyacyl-CoA dehydrogenase